MTATCVLADKQTNEIKDIDRKTKKHLSKRDSVVIVDTYPLEFTDVKKPKVIYRRISKQKYRAPKPKYGPPKPKYSVTKKQTVKKAYKKHKVKKVNSKFGLAPHKRTRLPKPRHPRPTPPRPNSKYSIPKHINQHQAYFADTTGFGEPPLVQMAPKEFEFKKPSQSLYAEPPVDSYGSPLKVTPSESSNPDEEYIDATVSYSNNHEHSGGMLNDVNGGLPKYHRWQDFPANQDNSYAHSNKHHSALLVSKLLNDEESDLYEDLGINSYSDIFKYNPNNPASIYDNHKIANNELIQNSQKYLNKPWKVSGVSNEDHDQIIVGGQYAEPPGRFVPKDNPNPSIYFDEDQIFSGFVKPETASSATMSSYVNYKHSNMAFSPQNLNDAFGIIEK